MFDKAIFCWGLLFFQISMAMNSDEDLMNLEVSNSTYFPSKFLQINLNKNFQEFFYLEYEQDAFLGYEISSDSSLGSLFFIPENSTATSILELVEHILETNLFEENKYEQVCIFKSSPFIQNQVEAVIFDKKNGYWEMEYATATPKITSLGINQELSLDFFYLKNKKNELLLDLLKRQDLECLLSKKVSGSLEYSKHDNGREKGEVDFTISSTSRDRKSESEEETLNYSWEISGGGSIERDTWGNTQSECHIKSSLDLEF